MVSLDVQKSLGLHNNANMKLVLKEICKRSPLRTEMRICGYVEWWERDANVRSV